MTVPGPTFSPSTGLYYNPVTGGSEVLEGLTGGFTSNLYAWSTSLLEYVTLTVDASGNLNVTGGGGGGGGAVTLADGADVTQGAILDAAVTTNTSGTVSGKLRGLIVLTNSLITAVGSPLQSGGSVSVSNFPATQPVSASFLPLPTGAAKDTSLTSINTTLGSPFQAGASIGNTSFGISGTLPAFAATPTVNLGTLNGAATSSELVTINTTLGSPLQAGGTVTANAGTNLNTSALALEAGNLATIVTNDRWGNISNRQYVTLSVLLATGATTEALLTLIPNTNGTAAAGATSYTVPAAKTFRIQAISADILNTTTVANRVAITLRAVPSGSVTTSSPVLTRLLATSQSALAATGGFASLDFPEGLCLPTGSVIGASQVCTVTTASIVSVVITGYLY